jgi:PAS domain S-box-containing protein
MEGRIIFVNDTFESITGYMKEEIYRENFIPFVHPDDRERASELWQGLLRGELYENVEYKIITKSGEVKWILSSWKIVEDGEGKAFGILGRQEDITDRVISERELKQLSHLADIKNKSKSNFLCNMSHEIRTPLTAIMGFTDLLISDENISPDKRRHYLNYIQSNSSHLLGLIKEILDLSQIEANAMVIDDISISVRNFFSQFYYSISSKAIEKDLDFSLVYKTDVPEMITIDPTRLRQVLFNLVGNAIKFTEKGFVRVEVSYDESEEKFIVDVHDSGIGIRESEVKSLFALYDQLNINITKKYGGTGLGLYLSSKIAEKLNGSIELVSTKLKNGSVFRLVFKGQTKNLNELVEIGGSSRFPNLDQVTLARLAKLKVLVVEDCEEIVVMLKYILDSHNIRYEIAENGSNAIEMVRDQNFNVVLMDLQLPLISGIEAASRIRKNGYKYTIIAISAFTSDKVHEECLGGDFDDFINKPIDINLLMNNLISIVI